MQVNTFEEVHEESEKVLEETNEEPQIGESKHLKLEDCFTVENEGIMKCNYCKGVYKKRGHLKTDLEVKHGKKTVLCCHCGKIFDDIKRYTRHGKTCIN